VQQHYDEIRMLGGEVAAISFAKPEKIAAYLQRHPLPFPALSDPTLAGYRAFQLGHASWWTFLSGKILWRYLRLRLSGWKQAKVDWEEDVLQLGGDFVLDRQGRIVYAYRSKDPTDRPAIHEVLDAIRLAK
jgi:peroxiredoxin